VSDNVTLPGTGEIIALDDVGGVKYQRVKLDIGGDGVSVPIVSGTPLPVSLDSSTFATSAKQDTIIGLLGGSGAPTQIWKSYNSTSLPAAGSAATVWDPAGGKSIVVTSILISSYGTTGYRLILYFGAAADQTYSEGTDQPLFRGSFVPSASYKPGYSESFFTPIVGTVDYNLYIQADAAGSVDVVVVGYEI
jgi:hypothetical protein